MVGNIGPLRQVVTQGIQKGLQKGFQRGLQRGAQSSASRFKSIPSSAVQNQKQKFSSFQAQTAHTQHLPNRHITVQKQTNIESKTLFELPDQEDLASIPHIENHEQYVRSLYFVKNHITKNKQKEIDRKLNSHLIHETEAPKSREMMNTLFEGSWPPPSEASPHKEYSDIFSPDADPKMISEENKEFVHRSTQFQKSLQTVLKSGTNEQKLEALEDFVYNHHSKYGSGLNRFNSHEQTEVFNLFWNLGGYDHMVEMMEQSENTHFKLNPLNMEFYVKAQLKGDYFNPHNALAVADILSERDPQSSEAHAIKGLVYTHMKNAALQMGEMLAKGEYDPNIIKLYGKCFDNVTIDLKSSVEKNYINALINSMSHYEKAFTLSLDPRYGSRLLHRQLEAESWEEVAKETARMIQMASIRDGGMHSRNYAVVQALLESAYVTKDFEKALPQIENNLLQLCTTEAVTRNVMMSLEDLSKHCSHPRLESFYEILENHQQSIVENTFDARVTELASMEVQDERNTETIAWESVTYDFKGKVSNFVPGNFKFSGALPAHNINRHDQKFFSELLKVPLREISNEIPKEILDKYDTLDQIYDTNVILTVIDIILRDRFNTDKWDLERLDSEGHKKYDDLTAALIAAAGVGTLDPKARMEILDSRTNVSAQLAYGLGDCRQHAQVKQFFFDMWQKNQIDFLLSTADHAMRHGDTELLDDSLKEFYELSSYSLKIFNCEIHLPVEKEGYGPRFVDGHMVKNEENKFVKAEPHTLNLLFKYDNTGNINSIRLNDAFYQTTYPFQDKEIDFKGRDFRSQGVIAGNVDLLDPKTGKLESSPIRMISSKHAKRNVDQYDAGSKTNRIIGLPIQSYSAAEALKQRDKFEKFLEKLEKFWVSQH